MLRLPCRELLGLPDAEEALEAREDGDKESEEHTEMEAGAEADGLIEETLVDVMLPECWLLAEGSSEQLAEMVLHTLLHELSEAEAAPETELRMEPDSEMLPVLDPRMDALAALLLLELMSALTETEAALERELLIEMDPETLPL